MAKTIGVGGSIIEVELAGLSDMTKNAKPIENQAYAKRLNKAQKIMQSEGISAVYINAGTNLYYFTGTRWHASERMVGAVIPVEGDVAYIAPAFEESTLLDFMEIKGKVYTWHEDESPYASFDTMIKDMGITGDVVGVDESTSYFIVDGLQKEASGYRYINAKPVTAGCRMRKEPEELALMQCAKNMTLEVHKAAARILREGITTTEVETFIHEAHKKVGAHKGSYFCIVLFGEATAYPHGVKDPQTLKDGDMVLIDTG